MTIGFRVAAICLLFLVESEAIFWIAMALAGEQAKWKHRAVFYVGFCAVKWVAVLALAMEGEDVLK